jgi:hypothetical protein
MNGHPLRLDVDEVWHALEEIDPVAALAHEVAHGGSPAQRIIPWPTPESDLVMLEDSVTGARCAAPADVMRAVGTAARCAFVARHLLDRMVVTAGVIGSGLAAQFTLGVIAQRVPGVSHVALCSEDTVIEPRVVDLLDLVGIGFTVADKADEAALGANLVIALGPPAADLRAGALTPRAVLVNASGTDLPAELVNRAGESYVDWMGLLGAHEHRHVARSRSILRGDFSQMLAGRPGHLDHVVLVELLDGSPVNKSVASRLHAAARMRGLGRPLPGPPDSGPGEQDDE